MISKKEEKSKIKIQERLKILERSLRKKNRLKTLDKRREERIRTKMRKKKTPILRKYKHNQQRKIRKELKRGTLRLKSHSPHRE
jgi:hypothetical protein